MLLLRKWLWLQTLTYGIVHTYLMLWSWERCQQFISPSATSYEHLHQLSHVLMCKPCSIPAAFPDWHLWRQSSAFGDWRQAVIHDLPWEMWSIEGTIHPSRTGGSAFGGKNAICWWLTRKNKEASIFIVWVTSYRRFRELCTASRFLYCRFLHALVVELLDGASVNKHSNHFSCTFLVKSKLNSNFKQLRL